MRNYKKTLLGFSLILCLLIASILYPLYGDKDYNEEFYIYNEQGDLIAKAPTPPTPDHLLGTDRNGQDMIYIHLYGAKFTIAAALIITLLRVLAGVSTGIIIALWLPKLKIYFKDLFLGFRFIPSIIIAIFMMSPFIGQFTGIPVWTIASYQIGVLTLIAYPAIVLLAIEYVEEIQKKSFVRSSYLMGAGKVHILKKHIWPFLKSIGLLMFVQQLYSTQVMLMHLGIFKAYLGGQTKGGIFTADDGVPPPETISNEWGGLIGQNFKVMIQFPWIVLSTMFFFFILIASTNMMKKELEGHLVYDNMDVLGKRKAKKEKETQKKDQQVTTASFRFVNNNQNEAGF